MIRLTRQQVREVDRRAIEEYHVPGVVLMENAARAVAEAAIEMLSAARSDSPLILCGGGNNGGDGLAAARHLHNRGLRVSLALYTDPARYSGDALINWRIIEAMRLPTQPLTPDLIRSSDCGLFIDALFGTGLTQPPRPPFDQIVAALDARDTPILAVDLPSGLDCDTGRPLGPTIRARRTVTFVAEKAGFANPESTQYTGQITVGDIGCPRQVIDAVLRGR